MEEEEEITKKQKLNPNKSESNSQDWTLWQLLDSILPTGGFAHSFGLESAVQSSLITHPESLRTFIITVLENTASLLLPFVHAATSTPDLATCRHLSTTLDAILTNEVARKASISQGSALLRVASAMFTQHDCLKSLRIESVSFHHAVVFGLVCGVIGLGPDVAQRAYLFVTLRDVISAATRLNLIGPQGGAVLQCRVAPVAEGILLRWKDRGVEDACQIAPVMDVVQGCHSYLFSRMFCS